MEMPHLFPEMDFTKQINEKSREGINGYFDD